MGSLLTVLCCFVWITCVVKDLDAATHKIIAATRLCSQTTKIGATKRIEALSTTRVAWFVLVQLVRIMIAVGLGFGGMRVLARTISLEGMLRTTVSLKL